MERLVSIIRSGNSLTARVARQSMTADFESPEAVARAAEEADQWYEITEQPLVSLEATLFQDKEKLLVAWQVLGQVREKTPKVLSALRTVLSATVLETPSSGVAPQTLPPGERRVKPTAAHPRAYQGTTDKPPKEKLPAPADLRPALCSAGRLGLLTEQEEARLAVEARLPEAYRASLYPLLRRLGDAETAEGPALYWALGLDHGSARLAAAVYLFSLHCRPNTGRWCRLAAALPEEHRTPLLHLLIASGAYVVEAQALPPSFAEQVAEVLTGADPLYRAYWLLHGLTTGISLEYLLSGYRLADAYGQSYNFHAVKKSGFFPLAAILQLGAQCTSSNDFYSGMLLRLWEQCGLRPGLGEFLEKTDWTRYGPDVACRCLRLYGYSWDNWSELSEDEAEAKWNAARPFLGDLEALLQSVPPEFQEKCVWHLIEYLWQWDAPLKLQANLPSAFTLTRRLCDAPFARKSDPTEVLTDFLAELSLPLREQFLNAPDVGFLRLEQACRRENDTWLIARGTWALTRQAGEFTVCCFETCPARLFKVAKLLGCLSGPIREEVVRTFAATMTTQDARLGLTLLEQEALRALAQGFPLEAETSTDRHALQVQRLITDNRRALRKFLEAHWRGQSNYLREHALTRRWLGRHPRLDLDVWLRGVPCEDTIEGWGVVSLQVEPDPLEALKLGTYVGSCLGLGGSFAYSAAATVLDINKQVVYARDKRGTVIGRQLVAVSEDDQLVCFDVYPLSAQRRLGQVFAEFDTRLAQALALPLHDPRGEDDYEIACILSHSWWDDRAWDLTIEEA